MNKLRELLKQHNNDTVVATFMLADLDFITPSTFIVSDVAKLVKAARLLLESGNFESLDFIEKSIRGTYHQYELKDKYDIPSPYKGTKTNWLIIGDVHAPYCHTDLFFEMRRLQDKFDLGSVACVGDIIDAYGMSMHDKHPNAEALPFEFKNSKEYLKLLSTIFPEMLVANGNHDGRYYKKMRMSGIIDEMIIPLHNLLDLPDTWIFKNEHELNLGNDKAILNHGMGGNAYKSCAVRGENVISGHYHSLCGVQHFETPNNSVWGMQVGSIVNDETLAFDYSRYNNKKSALSCGMIIDGQPFIYKFKK